MKMLPNAGTIFMPRAVPLICQMYLSVNRNENCTSDPLQSDGCKLSVLLTFHIYSTPVSRLGNLASRGASIDYTALRLWPTSSRGHEPSLGTSLAKVGHDGCKVYYV